MINRNVKELLQQADELVDASRFDEAIDIYQEIALTAEHQGVYPSLIEAWTLSHFKFLNEVIAKYPESKATSIGKINLLLRNHRATEAVKLCTQVLEKFGDNKKSLQLYTLRFKAAIQSGKEDYLAKDFLTIWRRLSGAKAKSKLLEDMLSTSNIQLASVYLALAEDSEFSPAIQLLFRRKAEHLEMLKTVYETELSE